MSKLINTLLVVLAVAVLSLSILAWKQHQELITLRSAALTNGERADWQKRVWTAQKRSAGAEIKPSGPRPVPAPTGTGPQPAPAGRAELGRMISSVSSMMDRPDTVRLMALQQKAQVDARYAALFKKLGLSPDKLAQLKSVLADKLAAPMDVMAAAGQQGVDPVRNPQEFHQLVQDAQAQLDDRIKALLNPSGYAVYQNYLQTEPQRAVVTQLEQSLSYTDTPLTTAQADQLVQILASTAPAQQITNIGYVGRSGSPTGPVVAVGTTPPPGMGFILGTGTITDAAVTQAQSVLSPAQLQALQEIQQQQQAAAQLRQQMFQHFSSGPTAAPATGGSAVPVPAPTPGG